MSNDIHMEWAFSILHLSPDSSIRDVLTRVYRDETCPTAEQRCAKDIVLALARRRHLVDANHEFPTHEEMLEDASSTGFQRLLVFILRRLFEYNLRRYNDGCYARVMTKSGKPTIAWTRVCSIRDFVIRETRKDVEPEFWRILTNPKDHLDILCRHICENDQYIEFPPLAVDDMLISWHNGTYAICDNVFWIDDCASEWTKLADDAQLERRQTGQWGADYLLAPPSFDVSSFNRVEREFRLCNVNNRNEIDLISDTLSQIGIAQESHWWLFVLIGRMFFPLHKFDRWQVMPFIKTHESLDNTMTRIFQDLFTTVLGTHAVALLSSGTNVHFALETIMNARVAFLVMRDSAPLEQGDWQSATCAETVCINSNTRGKASFSYEWATHLFAVGAYMPYKNDAATVERRVIMFDATTATVDAIDRLRTLIHDNVDLFLQTTVDAYLTAVHRYATRSLWDDNVLPIYLHRMRTKLREITNPLYSCLRSDLFEYNPGNFMPLSDFKDLYQEYRRQRGLPVQRWIRDHWHATFQELKLTIERTTREYHGTKSTADWIVGVDCVALPEDRQTMVITEDAIEELRVECTRCEQEHRRITARYTAARTLYDIETQIQSLKEERRRARIEFWSTNEIKAGESTPS